jgi:hypothetical protein
LDIVNASNFGPHGNFGPLFQMGSLSSRRVQQQIEGNASCRRTLDLQTIKLGSVHLLDSSKEATELAKKKRRSKASIISEVRGFYGTNTVAFAF